MHTFVKWPKIESLYNLTADKLDMLKCLNTLWVVTEKIDGTNFSLSITKDDYKVGRRNDYLGDGASFYNIFNNIYKLEKLITITQDYIKKSSNINRIIYFGEYFGNKVINRIYYGNDYRFRIFGEYVEYKDNTSKWVSFEHLHRTLCNNDLNNLIIPVFGIYDSVEDAFSFPNAGITSLYSDDKHNDPMEGIVIMPYNTNPIKEDFSYIIKNKNPKFLEKTISSNKLKVTDSELENLRNKFKEYCTESRMVSVFSKIGMPLNGTADAGVYIKEWLQDAYEDFIQDNSLTDINKGDKKFITSVGSLGFNTFCSTMNKLNK